MSRLRQSTTAGLRDGLDDGALRSFAPAKLNLTLEITGRRRDGYHELVSLVAFADIGDCVCLRPRAGRDVSLEVMGPFAHAIDGDNLVLRAARCFLDAYPDAHGGHFRLDKRLPVAAGVGGGSSDAAAAVRLLAQANAVDALRGADGIAALTTALSRLGADIPVCLEARAAWMTGIGENVTPLGALPELHSVLVNPGVPLATRDVFSGLRAAALPDEIEPVTDMPPAFGTLEVLITYLDGHLNDLEPPARALAPVVGEVLDALAAAHGCRIARLSGSGPTCFGLFGTWDEADAAASTLAHTHPHWWIASARLA